jgi:electron transport complex protein RnfC
MRLPKASSNRGLHWHKPRAPQIESLPLPELLKYPIATVQRKSAKLLVDVGSRVLKGQPLTASENHDLVVTHAGSSGVVSDISNGSVTVKTDGNNKAIDTTSVAGTVSRQQLITLAHRFGLTGHGGAGFSLAKKIAGLPSNAELLLVNAAECDPLIHCDDALIKQHTDDIIDALILIAESCNIKQTVIGIEDDKDEAITVLRQCLARRTEKHNITIATIPALYPNGAERLLLTLCTDKQVPVHQSLAGAGILSMNIASCYATGQALMHGMPPVSRITTVVASDGQVRNFRLPLGTPVNHLLQHIEHAQPASDKSIPDLAITVGGQMMNKPLTPQAVIDQQSNCIAFSYPEKLPPAVACIRCGACADVCPVGLMPQYLHKAAVHFNALQLDTLNLQRCIECRCCDVVCPSSIPLTAQFSNAKAQQIKLGKEQLSAELAKQRYDKRELRLQKQQSGQRKKRLKDTTKKASAQSRKDLIAQALQRSAGKKPHKQSDKPPSNGSPG